MTTIVQKTIVMIAIFLLTLSFNNVAKASCDEPITIASVLNDDCCVEITITNTNTSNCYTSVLIKQLVDNLNYQTVHSTTIYGGQTLTFTLCSIQPMTKIGWKIYISGNLAEEDDIDITDCCNCPTDKSSWLTFEIDADSPDCDTNQCKVTPILNIPDDITCYKYMASYEGDDDFGTTVSTNTTLPSFCVDRGESIDFVVSLMRNSNEDPDDYTCAVNEESDPCPYYYYPPCGDDPCIPDNATWELGSVVYSPPNCPLCTLTLYYLKYENVACDKIFFSIRNMVTEGTCLTPSCTSYNQEQLFQLIMDEFIDQEVTPLATIGEEVVQVALATCWQLTTLPYGYEYIACGDDCCIYTFDLVLETFVVEYPVMIYCDDYIPSPFPTYDCWLACGWSPSGYTGEGTAKISLPFEFNEVLITPNPAGDIVSIELPEINDSKIDIKIYALDGALVAHKSNIINKITLDTKQWTNGTYIVRILINEQEINMTYKFLIVH